MKTKFVLVTDYNEIAELKKARKCFIKSDTEDKFMSADIYGIDMDTEYFKQVEEDKITKAEACEERKRCNITSCEYYANSQLTNCCHYTEVKRCLKYNKTETSKLEEDKIINDWDAGGNPESIKQKVVKHCIGLKYINQCSDAAMSNDGIICKCNDYCDYQRPSDIFDKPKSTSMIEEITECAGEFINEKTLRKETGECDTCKYNLIGNDKEILGGSECSSCSDFSNYEKETPLESENLCPTCEDNKQCEDSTTEKGNRFSKVESCPDYKPTTPLMELLDKAFKNYDMMIQVEFKELLSEIIKRVDLISEAKKCDCGDKHV